MANVHSRLVMDRRARVLSEHFARLIPNSVRILDVGAGNGKLARAIANRRPDLTIDGIDTRLWPDRYIAIREFDGRTIPFDDDSYDVCLASDVLHHCDNPEALMAEMVRVARLYILVKDHTAASPFDSAVLRFMDWFGNRGHGVALPYTYWSWKTWGEAFDRLGLVPDATISKLGLYPVPLSLLFDRKLHFITRLKIENAS